MAVRLLWKNLREKTGPIWKEAEARSAANEGRRLGSAAVDARSSEGSIQFLGNFYIGILYLGTH